MSETRPEAAAARWSRRLEAAAALLPLACLLAAVALTAAAILQPWIEPRLLFADTIVAAQESEDCCHTWFGLISNLGVLAWFGAGAVSLFAAACLWRAGDRAWRPLAAAGALSTLFAFDDLLLLHEFVLPGAGVPQKLVLAVYAAALGAYVLYQRRALFSRAGGYLAVALLCFAASAVMDLVLEAVHRSATEIEDGFKFVGVVSWMIFHLRLAWDGVTAPNRA